MVAGVEQKLYGGVALKEDKRIKYLGFVQDNRLFELYQRASLFVFPSFYEGFGLPPLEAMALGCPVVASNTSSLPEVVGDAALTFDPNNSEELAVLMLKVLNDKNLSAEFIRRGIERAKLFSWENSAKQLKDIFEEVFQGSAVRR